MSTLLDEEFQRYWLDTDAYVFDLMPIEWGRAIFMAGAAAIRDTKGSWQWALEQMKQGKRLTYASSSVADWYIFLSSSGQILIHTGDGHERAWIPFATAFDETDWRLAKPKAKK